MSAVRPLPKADTPRDPLSAARSALPALTASRIVALCAIGMAVNFAPIFMATFPVMLKPMQAGLGFSRTGLTTGYALAVATMALSGPFIGRMIDLRGQRPFLIVGIPALALCLSAFSLLPPHNLPLYWLLCIVSGAVGAMTFQPVYYSILPPWFDRRLGIALAVAGMGGGAGIAIFAATAQLFVGGHGWRYAYVAIALISLLVGAANLILLRVPKLARRSAEEHAATLAGLDGPTLAEVVRLPAFWRLAAAYLLLCTMINGNFVHLVPMLTDRGSSAADAATMMVYVGLSGLLARLACGFLLLRIRPSRLGAVVFLLGVLGAALLLDPTSHVRVIVAVVLLGTSFGAEGELLNYTGRYAFGLRAQAAVLAMLSAAFLFGNLFGPMVMSICRDLTGSYHAAQLALLACGGVAALLHWGVRPTSGVIRIGTRSGEVATPKF